MNYNVLRYFSVLAQVEHYTLAAARLGISQPTLSSAIHNLENELGGINLFEKVGRNVRLTDEGRFYQEKVDAALQELHSASMMLRDSKIRAPIVIRMGYVSGTLDGLVARKIAECGQQNHRIRFYLTESSAENLMDMIREEKLDMAIVDTTNRDRSLHFRKLNQRDILSYVKQIAGPGSMHETGYSGLVHWDDPEGWDGEGGGRGVQDGEDIYTMPGSCQCMAKNTTIL